MIKINSVTILILETEIKLVIEPLNRIVTKSIAIFPNFILESLNHIVTKLATT